MGLLLTQYSLPFKKLKNYFLLSKRMSLIYYLVDCLLLISNYTNELKSSGILSLIYN